MTKRSIAPQRGFFPQPVYLIGCFNEDGRPNFTLKTWITCASTKPPIIMFTAGDAHQGTKETAKRVLETGVFSASLVTISMIELADYCGITSGYQTDKVTDTGVAWSRGAVLDVPVLDDSPWVYECAVVKTLDIGNGTVYFGEIKNILVDDGIPDATRGKVDVSSLSPAVYAPMKYFSLGPQVYAVGDSLLLSLR